MKVYISSTEWAVVCDLKETSLSEWLKNLKEQYPEKTEKYLNKGGVNKL